MEQVQLWSRLTHSFADGWASNDDWEWLGVLKVTAPRLVRNGNGHDDGGTYVRYARIPARADKRKFMQAVRDTMSNTVCKHEHDCCGCMSIIAVPKVIKPRVLKIRLNVSYNY